MRFERITFNKFKVSLSSDDLFERGISNEDVWKESNKWHDLFHDMLDEACDEFGLDIRGQVAVEVFSLQTQGMIVIITMEDETTEEDDFQSDHIVEMQVRLGGGDEFVFSFSEFEHIIQLCKRLAEYQSLGGSIYVMDNHYYLLFTQKESSSLEKISCLLSEYGNPSATSPFVLKEYGKVIIDDTAIATVNQFF